MITLTLYVVGLVLTAYLIYRYGRYSPWTKSDIGRAFMASKTSILAVFIFALTTALWPDRALEPLFRVVLIGYAILAMAYQIKVVVGLQGGFRRRHRTTVDEHSSR